MLATVRAEYFKIFFFDLHTKVFLKTVPSAASCGQIHTAKKFVQYLFLNTAGSLKQFLRGRIKCSAGMSRGILLQ